MKVCLIYSGWLRTWEQCKGNHAERLAPEPSYIVHYNETTPFEHKPYTVDEWGYNANKAPETEAWNTMNMWRAMYTAFQRATLGYDCYVRNRYDIIFDRTINFEEYPMTPDRVYIPDCSDYREGVNDQFAFGSYEAMEKYHSVYLNHKAIFDSGKMFHSESFLKHNLDNLGVKIVRIPAINTIIRG